jgi:hypothetical protein
MTLTNVLLAHVAKASLMVVLPAALLVWLLLGANAAVGLIGGALITVGDMTAMIYLFGDLLRPSTTKQRKVLVAVLISAKLVVVGAVLWLALSRFGLSPLGVVLGIGAGLIATVAGASWGSSSRAGQEAIARAERDIAKEMEDSGNQTR